MTKDKFILKAKPGDTIAFKYTNLLGKLVRFFMALGSKEKAKKLKDRAPYNHCGLIIEDDGYTWVYESSGGYIRRVKLKDRELKDVALYRPKKDMVSIDKLKTIATHYQGSAKYDYLGLIWHQLVYQLTGKWIGKTGDIASKRMYCGEYNAKCYKYASDSVLFQDWWLIDPEDIYNNRYFRKAGSYQS